MGLRGLIMDRKINPTLGNLESEGIELAKALNWDGYSVLWIALAGLTECNFHTLREKIEQAVNDYRKENHEQNV
jgi:hypothetical protein